MKRWKAWFVDVPDQRELHDYSSEMFDFADLPPDGCLGFLLLDDSTGRHLKTIHKSYDYYWLAENGVFGCCNDTLHRNMLAEIPDRYPNPVIIRGIWTHDETMEEVDRLMRES